MPRSNNSADSGLLFVYVFLNISTAEYLRQYYSNIYNIW